MSGSGIRWAMCKSAPRFRQVTMPASHHSVFLQDRCLSCHPTNSVKALNKAFSSFLKIRIFLWSPFLDFFLPVVSLLWLLDVVDAVDCTDSDLTDTVADGILSLSVVTVSTEWTEWNRQMRQHLPCLWPWSSLSWLALDDMPYAGQPCHCH